MIPIALNLRNFMSYTEVHEPLRFDGIHVAVLTGDNGHGKSALLDAITCALCECGFAARVASACCFASANRVPARMLKESSSTISSKRPFAPAAGRRTNGSANASTTSSSKANRNAKSSRYRNRRCRADEAGHSDGDRERCGDQRQRPV